MHILIRRLVAALLLIPTILGSPIALAGYREDMHATPVEIAQLPQFCWKQFEVPDAQGDQFTIRDCGVFVNHYCPALLALIRGKSAAARGKGPGLIGTANVDVIYTEKGIASYPNCPIREHVAATRAEIDHLLRIYGAKPARKK